SQTPVILGLNKSDLQTTDYQQIDATYTQLAETHNWSLIKFSALNNSGLDVLVRLLVEHLEPGPYYYPSDLVTDQPERFIIKEMIREQILLLTRQEIPHSVAIAIEKIEEKPNITRIFAAINLERESQKRILIGKQGIMLKNIGIAARQQIQKLIAGKVYLELFVKVQPKWRQSRTLLAEFGYHLEE
ncbi:MAG: GTPase Era, partial [Moorea sp. SIO2B7]|nr:GTPase Era [Moorena sp. SIO2B7]